MQCYQPKVLRIEPTNSCSARCIACPNKQIVRNQGVNHLDPHLISQVLFPSIEDVIFLQNGEFTEALYLNEILDVLRTHPVRLHVTTNGAKLNSRVLKALLRTNLATITFSIDSLDSTTFNYIRNGCSLPKVLDCLSNLVALKKKTHSIFPFICVNTTIMRSNILELPRMLVKFVALGVNSVKVDYARLHRFSVQNGDICSEESLYYHQLLSDDILLNCNEVMRSHDCDLTLPPLFHGVSPRHERSESKEDVCDQPWTDVVLWSNGNITPCTGAQNVIWGNLKKNNFEKIWFSKKAVKFREKLSSLNWPKSCKQCSCIQYYAGIPQTEDWYVF